MIRLGGSFFIIGVLLTFMFVGFYYFTEGFKRLFKMGKYRLRDKVNVEMLLKQLEAEKFFSEGEVPVRIKNRLLSQALSEASKVEGFFFGVADKGVLIKENTFPDKYDSMLVYGNNSIGFHWRGQL